MEDQREWEVERAAVEQQVARELRARTASGSLSASAHRKGSAFLPAQGDALHIAQGAIHAISGIHQRYERLRAVDTAAFAVAMLGVVLVLVDIEYARSSVIQLVLRCTNAALTLLLLVLVARRWMLANAILVARNRMPAHWSLWRAWPRVLQLLAELAVCAICVPPGVHGKLSAWEWKQFVDVDDATPCRAPLVRFGRSCYQLFEYPIQVVGLAALLRLYMLPRILLSLSGFVDYRSSYLGTIHRVDTLRPLFALKCLLLSSPVAVLTVAFSTTLLLTSYVLAILETPVNPALAPLSNALWLTVLTMGTIGYGDLTPVTFVGQVVLIGGAMVTGILLFGLVSATVFSSLRLDEHERQFLALVRRHEYDARLRNACAQSIQAAWGYYHARMQGVTPLSHFSFYKLKRRLLTRLATQRDLRAHPIEAPKSVALELQHCHRHLLIGLQHDHKAAMRHLAAIEQRLDLLLLQGSAREQALTSGAKHSIEAAMPSAERL